MNDEFAPDYITFLRTFKCPNPPSSPRMAWWMWAVVNALSLGVLAVVNSVGGELGEVVQTLLAASCILGPPLAAGVLDARSRTWAALTASGWAFMLIGFIAMTFTDGWRNDCGLGRGFALLFAMIGAGIYPVVTAAAYAPGRWAHRLRAR